MLTPALRRRRQAARRARRTLQRRPRGSRRRWGRSGRTRAAGGEGMGKACVWNGWCGWIEGGAVEAHNSAADAVRMECVEYGVGEVWGEMEGVRFWHATGIGGANVVRFGKQADGVLGAAGGRQVVGLGHGVDHLTPHAVPQVVGLGHGVDHLTPHAVPPEPREEGRSWGRGMVWKRGRHQGKRDATTLGVL
eukprot:125007-Chlamydomonas_euryale.AAC.1